MQINNNYTNTQILQSNYKNNTLQFADTSAKYKTEMDKVDITSKETIQIETVNKSDYSDEEISEFLKDKPYTAFMYEYYEKHTLGSGKPYVTDFMDRYYNKKPQESGFLMSMRTNSKALGKGLDTLEKFKEQLAREAIAQKATSISGTASCLPEAIQYKEDYGIHIYYPWGQSDNLIDTPLHIDSSFMYQDMRIDENGRVMILPKESDEWITRDEFIEMYPDYELYASIDVTAHSETNKAFYKGEDVFKKYAEEFISGLSEEEKKILKDNDIFASPALTTTGIKGIEQFTKDIDDIKAASVNKWSGLNTIRKEFTQLAEEVKLTFAKGMSRSELKEGDIPSQQRPYAIIPFYSNFERDAKLIKELGLSDYIKIDTSKMDLEKGTINGYRFDMDFINEYSECFYNPERDIPYMQSLFYTHEEYDKLLTQYGTAKNIEKAYLYAMDNNLSLDILSNDYTSAIGVEAGAGIHKELHSNLNGRDDFLESLFSEKNKDEINTYTNITINIELDLKSKYLSLLSKNDNINTLLDII